MIKSIFLKLIELRFFLLLIVIIRLNTEAHSLYNTDTLENLQSNSSSKNLTTSTDNNTRPLPNLKNKSLIGLLRSRSPTPTISKSSSKEEQPSRPGSTDTVISSNRLSNEASNKLAYQGKENFRVDSETLESSSNMIEKVLNTIVKNTQRTAHLIEGLSQLVRSKRDTLLTDSVSTNISSDTKVVSAEPPLIFNPPILPSHETANQDINSTSEPSIVGSASMPSPPDIINLASNIQPIETLSDNISNQTAPVLSPDPASNTFNISPTLLPNPGIPITNINPSENSSTANISDTGTLSQSTSTQNSFSLYSILVDLSVTQSMNLPLNSVSNDTALPLLLNNEVAFSNSSTSISLVDTLSLTNSSQSLDGIANNVSDTIISGLLNTIQTPVPFDSVPPQDLSIQTTYSIQPPETAPNNILNNNASSFSDSSSPVILNSSPIPVPVDAVLTTNDSQSMNMQPYNASDITAMMLPSDSLGSISNDSISSQVVVATTQSANIISPVETVFQNISNDIISAISQTNEPVPVNSLPTMMPSLAIQMLNNTQYMDNFSNVTQQSIPLDSVANQILDTTVQAADFTISMNILSSNVSNDSTSGLSPEKMTVTPSSDMRTVSTTNAIPMTNDSQLINTSPDYVGDTTTENLSSMPLELVSADSVLTQVSDTTVQPAYTLQSIPTGINIFPDNSTSALLQSAGTSLSDSLSSISATNSMQITSGNQPENAFSNSFSDVSTMKQLSTIQGSVSGDTAPNLATDITIQGEYTTPAAMTISNNEPNNNSLDLFQTTDTGAVNSVPTKLLEYTTQFSDITESKSTMLNDIMSTNTTASSVSIDTVSDTMMQGPYTSTPITMISNDISNNGSPGLSPSTGPMNSGPTIFSYTTQLSDITDSTSTIPSIVSSMNTIQNPVSADTVPNSISDATMQGQYTSLGMATSLNSNSNSGSPDLSPSITSMDNTPPILFSYATQQSDMTKSASAMPSMNTIQNPVSVDTLPNSISDATMQGAYTTSDMATLLNSDSNSGSPDLSPSTGLMDSAPTILFSYATQQSDITESASAMSSMNTMQNPVSVDTVSNSISNATMPTMTTLLNSESNNGSPDLSPSTNSMDSGPTILLDYTTGLSDNTESINTMSTNIPSMDTIQNSIPVDTVPSLVSDNTMQESFTSSTTTTVSIDSSINSSPNLSKDTETNGSSPLPTLVWSNTPPVASSISNTYTVEVLNSTEISSDTLQTTQGSQLLNTTSINALNENITAVANTSQEFFPDNSVDSSSFASTLSGTGAQDMTNTVEMLDSTLPSDTVESTAIDSSSISFMTMDNIGTISTQATYMPDKSTQQSITVESLATISTNTAMPTSGEISSGSVSLTNFVSDTSSGLLNSTVVHSTLGSILTDTVPGTNENATTIGVSSPQELTNSNMVSSISSSSYMPSLSSTVMSNTEETLLASSMVSIISTISSTTSSWTMNSTLISMTDSTLPLSLNTINNSPPLPQTSESTMHPITITNTMPLEYSQSIYSSIQSSSSPLSTLENSASNVTSSGFTESLANTTVNSAATISINIESSTTETILTSSNDQTVTSITNTLSSNDNEIFSTLTNVVTESSESVTQSIATNTASASTFLSSVLTTAGVLLSDETSIIQNFTETAPFTTQTNINTTSAIPSYDCVFPFRYLGQWYEKCISDVLNDSWCSLTADFDRDHKWKYCQAPRIKTTGGTGNGSDCVFPFIYQGVSFSTCIYRTVTTNAGNSFALFCSVTSNLDQHGLWGYCLDYDSCYFPFIYNGISYSDCISGPQSPRWCSTTANFDRNQMWTNCPVTCDGYPQQGQNSVGFRLVSDQRSCIFKRSIARDTGLLIKYYTLPTCQLEPLCSDGYVPLFNQLTCKEDGLYNYPRTICLKPS